MNPKMPELISLIFSGLLSHASSVQLQRGIGLSKNGAPAFAGSLDFDTKNTAGKRTTVELQSGFPSPPFVYMAKQNRAMKKTCLRPKINVVSSDGFKYHSVNHAESGLFQWQHTTKKIQLLYLFIGWYQ